MLHLNFQKVLVLLLSIFVTIFVFIPVFVLIFLPCYITRILVAILAFLFRPELLGLVEAQSSILAVDDLRGRPISTLFAIGLMRGPLDLQGYREAVKKYMSGGKTCNGEKILLPRLRQYYQSYFGFLFWKEDDNFSIENHVNLYEHNYETVDETTLLEITKSLERQPYTAKRSPWEILLVKNCSFDIETTYPEEEQWAIIYRIHHGLSDGYSLIKKFGLATELAPENLQVFQLNGRDNSSIDTRRDSKLKLYWIYLWTFIVTPYQLCILLLDIYDRNVWHIPESQIARDWNISISPKFSVDRIKLAKNHFKVAFTDVLTASVTGGIRNFFLKRNPKLLPVNMHAVVGQPWPNHPWKMCNHWTCGFLELPTGLSDKMKRLQRCHYNFKSLKTSPIPLINFALFKILGALPSFLIANICKNLLATLVISNITGPTKKMIFLSGSVVMEDAFFWGGLLRGNLGIGVTIVSYCNSIRFIVTADKAIMPTKLEVSELMVEVHTQLKEFCDN